MVIVRWVFCQLFIKKLSIVFREKSFFAYIFKGFIKTTITSPSVVRFSSLRPKFVSTFNYLYFLFSQLFYRIIISGWNSRQKIVNVFCYYFVSKQVLPVFSLGELVYSVAGVQIGLVGITICFSCRSALVQSCSWLPIVKFSDLIFFGFF